MKKTNKQIPVLMSVAMLAQTIVPTVSALTVSDTHRILSQEEDIANSIESSSEVVSSRAEADPYSSWQLTDEAIVLTRDLLLTETSVVVTTSPANSIGEGISTLATSPTIIYNYDGYTVVDSSKITTNGTTMSGIAVFPKDEFSKVDKIQITTGGVTKVFNEE